MANNDRDVEWTRGTTTEAEGVKERRKIAHCNACAEAGTAEAKRPMKLENLEEFLMGEEVGVKASQKQKLQGKEKRKAEGNNKY
ncbi:MAG: hypothetical protein Q9159_007496 [Coniocarpon cinnabarinum]